MFAMSKRRYSRNCLSNRQSWQVLAKSLLGCTGSTPLLLSFLHLPWCVVSRKIKFCKKKNEKVSLHYGSPSLKYRTERVMISMPPQLLFLDHLPPLPNVLFQSKKRSRSLGDTLARTCIKASSKSLYIMGRTWSREKQWKPRLCTSKQDIYSRRTYKYTQWETDK